MFPALFSTVLAQGTAFTYEGHLYDGSHPADGIYNFQFTVHDSFTNGIVVAGPLTNGTVGVTNGMFAVSLDFGSGIFNGEVRYLEIGVQTNGASGFTTLAPRQRVTPMPYAIMANTASNLLGPVPTCQLSGCIPLSQLPGTVLTNNAAGVTLNGYFVGNGSGLTNLSGTASSQSVNPNSLDNALWLQLKAANLQDYNCYNRFRWGNVMQKIAARQNIRLLMAGTGLVGFELLKGAWTNWLSANLTNAGYFTWYDSKNYTEWGTNNPGSYFDDARDTNWAAGYCVLKNSQGFQGDITYTWNVLCIYYLAWTNGTTFKVQTNNGGGGGFTDIGGATINAKDAQAGPTGAYWYWTNSAGPKSMQYNIVNTASGTNIFVSVGAWNTSFPSNSFTVGYDYQDASGSAYYAVLPGTNVMIPIYQQFNPDMILYNNVEGTNHNWCTNLPILFGMWTNACPKASIVVCATYPCIGEDVTGTDIEETMQRNNVVAMALNGANISLFDGHCLFESTNVMSARSLYLAGDPVHPSATMAAAYGYLLNAWLGFSDAALFNFGGDAGK